MAAGAGGRIRAVMTKDEMALSADRDLVRWLGLGIAVFSFTAAGWFFREVWQARQSMRSFVLVVLITAYP